MKQLNLLDSLILNDAIRVHVDAKDWKEAIKFACEPLEKAGVINSKYYEDILESTKKYGPYYIIAREFAMPHASATENSVLANGFSLVTLKEPVEFENGSKVRLLMCLAAKDGETHVKVAIPQVVAVFEDESNIDKIASFTTKEEIIDLIKSVDYTKYLID
ncbi:PTS sugar transporter subunit IIA [Mycoplasmopsis gallopavonis]|uniref:Ascorbate-specific PTS system EIIA component n=1 Tax=Mycoplasmopsis gallopavonis TaxID=76629 RepID=A0A449AZZ9_9BACT|nr:PTS sugar transporter subunit IIA [Mycoplasmopsis gallopavonis]RIV16539.1 PTS sugar transporter subunit IIAB [Mycoplasmopsis gallopavonis]VEU73077.1 ascorbate-specific PTS system enzyme II Ccomponent [Mycoplasmopsis gallopavonis]